MIIEGFREKFEEFRNMRISEGYSPQAASANAGFRVLEDICWELEGSGSNEFYLEVLRRQNLIVRSPGQDKFFIENQNMRLANQNLDKHKTRVVRRKSK